MSSLPPVGSEGRPRPPDAGVSSPGGRSLTQAARPRPACPTRLACSSTSTNRCSPRTYASDCIHRQGRVPRLASSMSCSSRFFYTLSFRTFRSSSPYSLRSSSSNLPSFCFSAARPSIVSSFYLSLADFYSSYSLRSSIWGTADRYWLRSLICFRRDSRSAFRSAIVVLELRQGFFLRSSSWRAS